MNGNDIQYLTGVSDLVRLDLEAAALTLIADGEHLTALYIGDYSAGWREIPYMESEFVMSLNAAKAKQAASLFSDDERIVIKPLPESLQLTGKSSRVALQKWREPREIEEIGRSPQKEDVDSVVQLIGTDFLNEIEIATNFTAETTMRPIFNGVRLQSNGDKLLLSAYDGSSVLYQSTVQTARQFGEPFDIVIADKDLLLGLRLVIEPGDMNLSILKGGQSAVFCKASQPSSLFRCATLVGKWPDMTKITEVPITGSRHKLTASNLKALANAGRFLDEIEIVLQPSGDNSVFKIQSSSGSYLCAIKGAVATEMYYNVDNLEDLHKLADDVEIVVPETPEMPTFVSAGDRRCWIASMYSARRSG